MLTIWMKLPLAIAALSVSACSASSTEDSAADGEAGWQLVWSDEFEGDAVDDSRWSLVTDCWGGGNEERQCYTAAPANSEVADGKLVISALHETASGAAWPEHMRAQMPDPDAQATKPFTSAKLVTKGKASWQYGKIEVRAKLPQGQGVWPAIWMLPEEDAYGTWAASGEIDILEAVNLGVGMRGLRRGRREHHPRHAPLRRYEWPNNLLASTEVSRAVGARGLPYLWRHLGAGPFPLDL